jgi:peptidyl-prolyl cis-trans isomerase C
MITINGIQVTDRLGAIRELLRQRAVETGLLAADPMQGIEIDEALEHLLEREVRTPEPSDEECRRYYDAHLDLFTAGELAFVRHILFAVTPGVPVAALRANAEETLREVQTEPALFEQRAKRLSNCPSGEHGGNLGQLSRGESVPEFDKAIFDDQTIGILPRLVNTRYGFHVVSIDGRVPGRLVPFEVVHAQIAERLTQSVRAKALQQYVSVLAGQADVCGVELGGAASPLVQ